MRNTNWILIELDGVEKTKVFSTIIECYNQKRSYEKYERKINWTELIDLFLLYCDRKNIQLPSYIDERNIEQLTNLGFDIDFIDAYDQTLLGYLLQNKQNSTFPIDIKFILKTTKNLFYVDKQNRNILFYLMNNQNYLSWKNVEHFLSGQVFIEFIEKNQGFDLHLMTKSGHNLMNELFLGNGSYLKMYHYLKSYGVSTNHKTERNETLLHYLSFTHCNTETKQIFLDLIHTNSLEEKNKENKTMLDLLLDFLPENEDIEKRKEKKWLNFIFHQIIENKIEIKNYQEMKTNLIRHKNWEIYQRNSSYAEKILLFLDYIDLDKQVVNTNTKKQQTIKV
jgi:hypothetical protein